MNKGKQKGITLIALIITIIVMLILVAVTVRTAVNGGLFGHSKDATEKWADAQRSEANIGNDKYIEDTINNYTPGHPLAGKRVTENTEYKDGNKTATIPAGFTPSGVKSEQSIDAGLVIYLVPERTTIDWTNPEEVENAQRTYDQFVWIPIADINDIYMCQSENGTKSCKITVENGKAKCTTHNSELMAGRLYATDYREKFDSRLTTQTYTANSGVHEPDIVIGTNGTSCDAQASNLNQLNSILGTSYGSSGDLKNDLQGEYNEVVKSVYENKGFYVGRYETSNITRTDGDAVKSVAGATPSRSLSWYYMYAQQRDYAINNNLVVGSTMIQGAAYDQVMKFVNTADFDVKATTNVGHSGEDFTNKPYQTGGRDYSTNYKGTTQYNDVSKNIFDLEGNVYAMTTEAYGPCNRVYRGGFNSADYSASYRFANHPFDFSKYSVGTLIQIFPK